MEPRTDVGAAASQDCQQAGSMAAPTTIAKTGCCSPGAPASKPTATLCISALAAAAPALQLPADQHHEGDEQS